MAVGWKFRSDRTRYMYGQEGDGEYLDKGKGVEMDEVDYVGEDEGDGDGVILFRVIL